MIESEYKIMSDHDLLVALNVKQDSLEKQFTNHLQHHWAVTMAACGAALTGAVGFIFSLIILLIKR
jgi:hypothetical protein